MKNHEGNVELQKKVHRIYIYIHIYSIKIYTEPSGLLLWKVKL